MSKRSRLKKLTEPCEVAFTWDEVDLLLSGRRLVYLPICYDEASGTRMLIPVARDWHWVAGTDLRGFKIVEDITVSMLS